MFQTSMIQSVLKGLDPIHAKTITLKPGQIFSGKIIKLYPGQLASLQLGGMHLTAKLEAALTAGQRYWFQVQSGDGLPNLKLINNNAAINIEKNDLSNKQLLKELGIQQTKAHEMLLSYFSSKQQPFTKDQVIAGANTLTEVAMVNEQGIKTLQTMIQRGIPITPATFLAVQHSLHAEPLTTQLDQLGAILENTPIKNKQLQQLEYHIKNILTITDERLDGDALKKALDTFLRSGNENKAIAENPLLQKIGMPSDISVERYIEQIGKKIAALPTETQKLLWPTFSKQELLTLLGNKQATTVLQELVVPQGEKGNALLQSVFSTVASSQSEEGQSEKYMFEQLKQLINRLGVNYERDVSQFLKFEKDGLNPLTQLKSQLLQAQQFDLPIVMKETIDGIIQKITGQQLLSTTQDGPIHQIAIVLPLKLLNHQTDVTIQWEGKKQQNGQLDPNHCRIIFYLELARLEETVIDVQIQNRIISISIFNDHERPNQLIETFKPALKNALLERNYQLLSIKWLQPQQEQKQMAGATAFTTSSYAALERPYQGVDIRI